MNNRSRFTKSTACWILGIAFQFMVLCLPQPAFADGEPKIIGIYPNPVYPIEGGKTETYNFEILGDGFTANTQLFDDKRGEIRAELGDCSKEASSDTPLPPAKQIISINNKPQQIRFCHLPKDQYAGLHKLWVLDNGKKSETKSIVFSRFSRTTPVVWAIIVFLALVAFAWRVTNKAINVELGGVKEPTWAAFLIDSKTNTLSLSRFQFLVWLGVAIFSYSYLVITHVLVQAKFEFVEFPAGLNWIMGLSVATIVGGSVANDVRPKGAGAVKTSLADLYTTGGVVALDRFQLFVWTLLGSAAFVFLVVLQDPAMIQDLPQIPDGFLQLMGISSAGYLGGKLGRRPGPQIEEISAQHDAAANELELTIIGHFLSKSARYSLEGIDLKSTDIRPENENDRVLVPGEQAQDETLARKLKIRVLQPKPEWLPGAAGVALNLHLTLTNPDSQSATYPVSFPGMTGASGATGAAGTSGASGASGATGN